VDPPARTETERAVDLAYQAVGRRDRTVAELRAFLEGKRAGPAAIGAAVKALQDAGYLDDERYARRFTQDKRELERWGTERIARDLHRRGVPAELVERALA
jgi:regulatory protein